MHRSSFPYFAAVPLVTNIAAQTPAIADADSLTVNGLSAADFERLCWGPIGEYWLDVVEGPDDSVFSVAFTDVAMIDEHSPRSDDGDAHKAP